MMCANKIIRFAKTGVFIIPLLFILTGCGDKFVGPTATGVIMPLKVGNQWIGRWTPYGGNGSGASRLDTLTIISEVQRGNERWYKGSDGVLYINRADGLWRYSEDSTSCMGEVLLAKYPAAVNDTFGICTATPWIPGAPRLLAYTEATVMLVKDSTIKVPAGTYSCQVYRPILVGMNNDFGMLVRHSYYAPDVGPVKKMNISGFYMSGYTWELVSVRLQ